MLRVRRAVASFFSSGIGSLISPFSHVLSRFGADYGNRDMTPFRLFPSLFLFFINLGAFAQTAAPEYIANDAPAWSPDGTHIAFQSDRDGRWRIWIIEPEKGKPAWPLTPEHHHAREPHWSPDGRKIAYVADVEGNEGNSEIFAIDVEDKTVIQLTQNPEQDAAPQWSPDGGHIAFASTRNGWWDVYIMNADGSDVRRLTFGKDGQ